MSGSAEIGELRRGADLLFALLNKEISVRYKQSVVGPLWAFLQPLGLTALFVMIQNFVPIDSGAAPYPIVVYAAMLPWTFFATSLNFATGSIVSNGAVIRKIRCPRVLFPIAAVMACLVDFLIGLPFLGALMVWYRIELTWNAILMPLVLALQLFLILGLTLATSAVSAYRRDLLIGMPYLLQFWMFASPVMYRSESVPASWRSWFDLNPMSGIIEAYRSLLIYGTSPNAGPLLVAAVVASVAFLVGALVFARLQPRFADVV